MRIAARLALETPFDARGADRQAVAVQTTLRALGYHGRNVLVRDISSEGFKAEADGDYPVGAYVRLKLPGIGVVLGQVAWATEGCVGGSFVTPLEPGRLARAMGVGGAAFHAA